MNSRYREEGPIPAIFYADLQHEEDALIRGWTFDALQYQGRGLNIWWIEA